MKISQKGLYALQAMMMLARHYNQGAIRIRDIAYEEVLPEKFLELILLELKNARIVESVRGAKGGYQLRRPPSEIRLSEIIRLIDGPLAPFGDAEQLRSLIDSDLEHRALYKVFWKSATPRPRFWSTPPWPTSWTRNTPNPANAQPGTNTRAKMRECCPWCFRQTLAGAGKTESGFPPGVTLRLALLPCHLLYTTYYIGILGNTETRLCLLLPKSASSRRHGHTCGAVVVALPKLSTIHSAISVAEHAIPDFLILLFCIRVVLHRATNTKRRTRDSNNETERR